MATPNKNKELTRNAAGLELSSDALDVSQGERYTV